MAIDEGVPPYIIVKDKTIIEMCKVLPTDSNSMLTISGMGSKKIDKYGSKFIEVIKAHIE
jgi:ATP-dependent DNA helicase RecQ